jgi:hypothetical protein
MRNLDGRHDSGGDHRSPNALIVTAPENQLLSVGAKATYGYRARAMNSGGWNTTIGPARRDRCLIGVSPSSSPPDEKEMWAVN